MNSTIVEIVQDGSYRAAQPTQVPIVEGNSIQFSNPGSGGTELVLTPESIGILSPRPDSSVVEIASGVSIVFTFLKPSSDSYCCQVLSAGDTARPITCAQSEDGAVLTILSSEERGGDARTGRGL